MTSDSSDSSAVTIDVGGKCSDELFAGLSNACWRLVLRSLQLGDREMSVSKLTSDVVSWEADMTDSQNVEDAQAAIGVALVHTHLPGMARAGLVHYDEDAETVALIDRDRELDQHLGAGATATAGDD